MPQPNGPRRPTPEDLARAIARRLAEQGEVKTKPFSFRDSVLVGRLISGLLVLATVGLIVLGAFAGVDWVLTQSPVDPPQVLAGQLDTTDPGATTTLPSSLGFPLANLLDPTATSMEAGKVFATLVPGTTIGVPLPPPTTTSTVADTATADDTTTTQPQVTTTQPATSSSVALVTTSTTTTTSPTPTIPPTTTTTSTTSTTTTTILTTTTTIPTTTTTVVSTTTTFPETTTTCGNNGSGKGNC